MTFPLRLLPAPLALLLSLPGRLLAQQLDPTFHIPAIYAEAGVSDAVQQPDGQYVVAGGFTRVNGQAANLLTRLDAAGNADPVFRQNLSTATLTYAPTSICLLASGKLLLQGTYQTGSTRRPNLYRLNADGTLDPTFTLTQPPSPYPNYPEFYPNIFQLLEQPDGRVLLVRDNLNTGNKELIRLNVDGTPDAGFTAASPAGWSYGYELALQPDGKIIVSGGLTVGTTTRPGLMRLQANGTLDTSYQPAAGYGAPLTLDAAGRLLVNQYDNGSSQSSVVRRLLPSGAPDPSFTPDASLNGRSCEQLVVLPDGNIVVQLALSDPAGTAYPFDQQLRCLLPSGALNSAFQVGTGADYPFRRLRATAGGLLGWGNIRNYNGQRRTLALLSPTGTLDAGFAPLLQQPGQISRIVRQVDGKVLLAGLFNSLDGHLTDGLGRLLPDGQPDLTFSYRQLHGATWQTQALAVQPDGKPLVAGVYYDQLRVAADAYHFSLSRLTDGGAVDASFAPVFTVAAGSYPWLGLLAALPGGQVLAGGNFLDAAGRSNLTRLTATGAVDATFTPSAAQPVVGHGLVQANGLIMTVTPNAPASVSSTLRLLPTGQPDPSFTYSPLAPTRFGGSGPDQVYTLPVSGHYLTTEPFSTADATQRLAATGAGVPGFGTPYTPCSTPALPRSGVGAVAELPDGRLLVGGLMQETYQIPATTPRTALARLQANGQRDPAFDTNFLVRPSSGYYFGEYAVQALCVQPDGKALVGGYFLQAGTQAVTGLVRLNAPAPLATTAGQRSAASIEAWPVPAREALHVALDPAAHPQRVALLNALGQVVLARPVTQPELTLPTAGLPPGFYLLRVEYADGVAVRSVAVE